MGHLCLIIPAKKLISARDKREKGHLSRRRRRLSRPPGRCSGPSLVGMIERPDFRIPEQPGGLLD